MTQTPEISAAADLCRAAFKAFPNATHAWCCHHEVLCEPLTESFENRIDYILSDKAESERVVRLNNFRPVQDAEKFEALHTKYEADLNALDDKFKADRKPLHEPLMELYRHDVPMGTWNGVSIFGT
jgi:hypothetical protein